MGMSLAVAMRLGLLLFPDAGGNQTVTLTQVPFSAAGMKKIVLSNSRFLELNNRSSGVRSSQLFSLLQGRVNCSVSCSVNRSFVRPVRASPTHHHSTGSIPSFQFAVFLPAIRIITSCHPGIKIACCTRSLQSSSAASWNHGSASAYIVCCGCSI